MANHKKGKAKKVEEVKKQETGLLDDVSLEIVAGFSIVEIKMKNDWRWKIKMLVHKILPSIYKDYSIKLIFDDEPFLKTIAQLERELADAGSHPSMFPEVDRKTTRELQGRIDKAKQDMENLKRDCPTIEFVTQMNEMKYQNADTAIIFNVLDSVIQPLNEQKYRLTKYRAVMEPIFTDIKK